MNLNDTLAQINLLLLNYPELQEDEVLRLDMLEGATNAFDLVDALIERMAEAKTLAIALEGRITELRARRDRMDRREDAIREALFKIMQASGAKKLERPSATLSIRAGQPSVVITDEGDIPSEFFRVKREVNKTALKDALKSGAPILGAVLGNPEPTLSVRVA